MLTPTKQKNIIGRLNRIEGQVKGIKKMVLEPRYCPEILNQIAAVRRALDSVSLEMIQCHMSTCVTGAIKRDKGEASINELVKTLERFVR